MFTKNKGARSRKPSSLNKTAIGSASLLEAAEILRSGLAMWFVHWTLPLSPNYDSLSCFVALLPRSFVLVRCLQEANVANFLREV